MAQYLIIVSAISPPTSRLLLKFPQSNCIPYKHGHIQNQKDKTTHFNASLSCVCLCEFEKECTYACQRSALSIIPQLLSTCSMERDPSLTCKLLLGLDWMVSMSQKSSHLGLPNTGIVWTTCPSFTWALGTVLRSLKPACFSKIISYQLQQ